MKALFNIVITYNKEKKNNLYFNKFAFIHMTHDLNIYITPNLEY